MSYFIQKKNKQVRKKNKTLNLKKMKECKKKVINMLKINKTKETFSKIYLEGLAIPECSKTCSICQIVPKIPKITIKIALHSAKTSLEVCLAQE